MQQTAPLRAAAAATLPLVCRRSLVWYMSADAMEGACLALRVICPLHPGRPAATDWTDGEELGAVERIMLLERDAALADSVRTAALHAGPGHHIVAVMGALIRPLAPAAIPQRVSSAQWLFVTRGLGLPCKHNHA